MIQSIRSASRHRGAIAQRLLGDTVFERLLADIISGRFTPHERLRVDDLAYELAVSRTPVREAITRLAWTGFVEVARNSHTQIADWDATDMQDRLVITGRLVTLALTDPRFDLSELRLSDPEADAPAHTARPDADIQLFLELAEDITLSPWSRSVNRVLLELLHPLALYFTSPVMAAHGVDLARDMRLRTACLGGLADAVRAGDRESATRQVLDYVAQLAPLLQQATAPSESRYA